MYVTKVLFHLYFNLFAAVMTMMSRRDMLLTFTQACIDL